MKARIETLRKKGNRLPVTIQRVLNGQLEAAFACLVDNAAVDCMRDLDTLEKTFFPANERER